MSRSNTARPRPARPSGALSAPAPAGLNLRLSAVLLSGLGVGLLALSFSVLDWYDTAASTLVSGSYADLRDVALLAQASGQHLPWILRSYFSGLALGAFLALVGLVACTLAPGRYGAAARLGASVAGAGGIVASLWAVQDLSDRVTGRSGITVLTDAQWGIWACLLGFLALGLAGAIGLRRR